MNLLHNIFTPPNPPHDGGGVRKARQKYLNSNLPEKINELFTSVV